MNLAWMILVCLFQEPATILLPAELERVSTLETCGEFFWIYDHPATTFWKLDRRGRIANKWDKRGYGPGEFIRASRIRPFGEAIYICDWARRSILVFDRDFKFIVENRFNGLVRDVLLHGDISYVVYWSSEDPTMIKKVGPGSAQRASFGTALEDERLLGSQAGALLTDGNHLYFLHGNLPWVEKYSFGGVLEKRYPVPGLAGPQFAFEMLTNQKTDRVRRDLVRPFIKEGMYYFELVDFQEETAWIYRLRLATGQFDRIPRPPRFIATSNGETYQIKRDRQDKDIALTPLVLAFDSK